MATWGLGIKKHIFAACIIALFVFAMAAWCFSRIALLGILIGIIIWLIMVFVVWDTLKYTGSIQTLKALSLKEQMICGLFAFVSAIFVLFQVSQEKFIYYWDYGGYWRTALSHSVMLFVDPLQTLITAYESINIQEYNFLLPLILALPLKIFGGSFLTYTFVLSCLFLLPTFLVCALIVNRMLVLSGIRVKFYIIFAAFCLFPAFYIPLLNGFIDIMCVMAMALCYLLTLDLDFKTYQFKRCFLIAILLLFTILSRRYFIFSIMGYIFALCCMFVYSFAVNEKDKAAQVKLFLQNMLTIGLLSLLVLVLLFTRYLYNATIGNPSGAYKAYNISTVFEKIIDLVYYFSPVILIVAVFGLVYGLNKKSLAKPFLIFYSSSALMSAVFYSIKFTMAMHHFYLIVVQVAVLFVYAICLFIGAEKMRKIAYGACLLYAVNFMYAFSVIPVSSMPLRIFQTELCYAPRIRDDIGQVKALTDRLADLSQDKAGIYVLASSSVINDDIIRQAYVPELLNYPALLNSTAHVDLRDGFPISFLNSDIVAVAEPVQTHLAPQAQQCVVILSELMLDSTSIIADNFELIETMPVSDVSVRILQKTTPFSIDELVYLQEIYDQIYPTSPELFKQRIQSYIDNVSITPQ